MLVSMSVDIKAPPEVVWPYLVEPEKCTRWLTALKSTVTELHSIIHHSNRGIG